jgi:hypothetical protein
MNNQLPEHCINISIFSIGNSQQPTLFCTSLYLVLRFGTTGFGLHKDNHQILLQIIDIGTLPAKEGKAFAFTID